MTPTGAWPAPAEQERLQAALARADIKQWEMFRCVLPSGLCLRPVSMQHAMPGQACISVHQPAAAASASCMVHLYLYLGSYHCQRHF